MEFSSLFFPLFKWPFFFLWIRSTNTCRVLLNFYLLFLLPFSFNRWSWLGHVLPLPNWSLLKKRNKRLCCKLSYFPRALCALKVIKFICRHHHWLCLSKIMKESVMKFTVKNCDVETVVLKSYITSIKQAGVFKELFYHCADIVWLLASLFCLCINADINDLC